MAPDGGAVERGGAAAGAGAGVEQAGGLPRGRQAQAPEGGVRGVPRRADGARADKVGDLELAHQGDEGLFRKLRPVRRHGAAGDSRFHGCAGSRSKPNKFGEFGEARDGLCCGGLSRGPWDQIYERARTSWSRTPVPF